MEFDLRELLDFIFSEGLQLLIPPIIVIMKLIRSVLGNIKGKYALWITLAIALAVGEVQHMNDLGWLFAGIAGLLAGVEAAGIYRLTKVIGKNVIKLNKE